MDQYEIRTTDPASTPEESRTANVAEKKVGTFAVTEESPHSGVGLKRFHETHEDLSKIIQELKTIQNSNKKQCLELYKYMTSCMQRQGGDDILKRRRVIFPDPHRQQKPKPKHDSNSAFRHLRLACQKLRDTKEDLTYVISQIKFFNIGLQYGHRRKSIFGAYYTKPEQNLVNAITERETVKEEPQTLNLWDTLLGKLKNSGENELLFETRFVKVEKLNLHDSATMSLDKRRKNRKILMTRKKESVFTSKRKLIRTQIKKTPPWRWGNNGRYFENVPNVPFAWRLIFAELEETDKHNFRLVSRHWKTIVEHYFKFVYNAQLTDDTITQIDASLLEFNSLSVGPLSKKIPDSWQPGCFSEVKKLIFLSSVSQENIERLSQLFQHLPYLACENAIGFRWLMPNVSGFHQFHKKQTQSGKLSSQLKPFGGEFLTRFELSFTTFSPWQCAVFIEMVISDFPRLEDFTVKYKIADKEHFGWTGQERNHFYEVYLSVFTFIAIHLHSLRKATVIFSIAGETDSYDALPFGMDLPWLPGFPNYEELVAALEMGSLEEVYVHLCPWEQRGVFFWSLSLRLIQAQSKLKKVTIENMGSILDGGAPNEFFQNSRTSLESVTIKYPMEPFSCEVISECTNLKEFTFMDKMWKINRLDDIVQMPLSVQKITLDTYLYKLPDPVESWIIEHLTNVEDLVLSGWAHAHVAVTYLALPKLKKLTIQNCFPTSAITIRELCALHYHEVRIRYQKKRTCVTGTLIIRNIRNDENGTLRQ